MMRGDPGWSLPDDFAEILKGQRRLVVRVKPERVSGVLQRG
jgi:hypothetical protein